MYILMGFIKNGKDVHRIYFRFIEIISSSAYLFHQHFEELVLILA